MLTEIRKKNTPRRRAKKRDVSIAFRFLERKLHARWGEPSPRRTNQKNLTPGKSLFEGGKRKAYLLRGEVGNE